MSELLSPAGTIEAFHAAISNGANAIYLGLDKYSARAYANNFTMQNLKELVPFAHLRNVKIFVTINTIAYDFELKEIYKTIDQLAEIGVDAIIVQDLAIFHYIASNYSSIHAHVSTQMGIDDIEGAKLVKKLGATRIVFARETKVETIKNIKNELNIETEAFIHGALCVSYSGNCLMSSSIGERSGNRGRCAGCCRKLYSLINLDEKNTVKTGYLLSMKDLNTSENIDDMRFIDSLKIEGRMKEPNYVASVTRYYRNILDHNKINKEDIYKCFNRTYTKGFMNGDSSESITNIEKPNNYGYEIGYIEKQYKGKIVIKLSKTLNKGDQIRVETKDLLDEISLPVLKMFDSNLQVITSSNKYAVIDCNRCVNIGAKVYKTKDTIFVDEANKTLQNNEYEKLDLNMDFIAKIGEPITLKVTYKNSTAFAKTGFDAEEAKTAPTTRENIKNQLSKLNDTPYKLNDLYFDMDDNLFIPLKSINELRRIAVEKLNSKRLKIKVEKKIEKQIIPQKAELKSPEITVEVSNQDQFEVAKVLGIKHIYYKNIVRRNNAIYKDIDGEILVGGLNGINYYKGENTIVSDYSLNVVNYKTAALLSSLGVSRITLSGEISKENINNLVSNYYDEYKTYPNLELIVYGRTKIMHTKYCPLKRLGLCGKCKENKFALKDEYATFPLIFNEDCTINILNSKQLNIMEDLDDVNGINYYRLVFTTETKDETKKMIESFVKILNKENIKTFDPINHTRGHFIKNPL